MPKLNPTQHLLTMMADTTALAKMDAQTLADEMNKAVRAAFASAKVAAIKADELEARFKRESEDLAAAINDGRNVVYTYDEKGAMVTIPVEEFRKRVDSLKTRSETAIATAESYNQDFNQYMETQMAMFRSKGLDVHRAYKEMIIGVGEMKKPNGETLQLMRIIKRDCDLEPVEVDEEIDATASGKIAFSYSGAVGMAKEEKRGKYNDAAMLINGEAESIDRSEYTPWVQM